MDMEIKHPSEHQEERDKGQPIGRSFGIIHFGNALIPPKTSRDDSQRKVPQLIL
jgi:hypothetical protein